MKESLVTLLLNLDMSSTFFIKLLNMSCQAALTVCFVLIARQILSWIHAPKRYTYYLWIIPFLRMICPFSFRSPISLIPEGAAPIPAHIVYDMEPRIHTGSAVLDQSVSQFLPSGNPYGSVNPLQIWLWLAGYIWFLALICILAYSVIACVQLKKKLVGSIPMDGNVYLADHIDTPFVLGVIKPRIYFPSELQGEEFSYILKHEQIHIKRHDPLFKLLAFLITSVHWFNPLAWIAFRYFCRDMEMSCDEQVIASMGTGIRKEYADSLLRLSVGKFRMKAAPLAFGEDNLKARVKNIVKYRKPVLAVVIAAGIGCAVFAVALLSNPETSETDPSDRISREAADNPPGDNFSEHSGEKPEVQDVCEPVQIPVTAPVVSRSAFLGSDDAILDYADEHTVIFHGYFGLFVYSLDDLMMTGAVNLENIGCQMTQGDHSCDVAVEEDGSLVYLHPIDEKKMYVYHVKEQELYQTDYHMDGITLFTNFVDDSIFIDEYIGFRSARRVPFPREETVYEDWQKPPAPVTDYGYLTSYDGTVGALNYSWGDMEFVLFPESAEQPYPSEIGISDGASILIDPEKVAGLVITITDGSTGNMKRLPYSSEKDALSTFLSAYQSLELNASHPADTTGYIYCIRFYDETGTLLQTFTPYSDEVDIDGIRFRIDDQGLMEVIFQSLENLMKEAGDFRMMQGS